ncbi:MAG: hypothetical protein O2878_07030 [Bacteroidetes bacterium]|nr:hypothetical protein [Bacteroidota bacterium]MDA0936860.1 hypothetical protein [Bacteroidota bacterium]
MKKYCLLFLLILVSCIKEVIPDPEPAMLLGPLNNNNCNTAIVVNDQQSQVNFSWQEAQHTDEYELVVRDLLTNTDAKKNSIRLFTSMVLERGKQYSWWVNSLSDQKETVGKSEIWTFYLEGLQNSSHFPFPAKLISPENNAQVSLENGAFTLRWEGVDLDDDIISYDIYIGTDPDELQLRVENHTINSISANLMADQIYYWKVTTRDDEGNVSNSLVGSFRTTL